MSVLIRVLKFLKLYFLLKKLKYRIMDFLFSKPSGSVMQTASTTFYDRHPDLFLAVKNIVDDHSFQRDIKVLSFGSSTGEECFTLRKYFPTAIIVGAEINSISRGKAIKNNLDSNIIFIDSVDELIAGSGPYDVIFALSVLCKNPEAMHTDDLSSIYSFDTFERFVGQLCSNLNTGGWLVIRSSNYSFTDSELCKEFNVVRSNLLREPQDFPKFYPNGIRKENFKEHDEIFQKL